MSTEISTAATVNRTHGPRAPLSVVVMTAGPGPRVTALLATLRDVAEEIVVAVDDRSEASTRSDLATVADRLILYPYAEPVDRPLPWLYEQCRSEWALVIDDDELPSLALIEALPRLCGNEVAGHYSLPRRWLYPDSGTYLDDAPWRPDYALRLFRTGSALIGFSDEFHRPIYAHGPGEFVEAPLWHLDPILRPYEQRREKAWRYERLRPGMRVAGRALNFAFYLPEARADPPLALVPENEREHIESVLHAAAPTGPARARIEHVSRADIDRRWPADQDAPEGRLDLIERPVVLCAGEQRTLDARVHNDGRTTWPWGGEGVPRLRIRSSWRDPSGRTIPEVEVWTVLPSPLAPGRSQLVPVHVRAPERTGTYSVEVDLLDEDRGPFGEKVVCDVHVRSRRRLGVVGDDAAATTVAAVLETVPEVELLRLRRTPDEGGDRYAEAADLRSYLFDDLPPHRPALAAALLWRALRLRLGPTPRRAEAALGALRGLELLVIAGPDGPPQRRERFATAALARAARSLGIPVVYTREPEEILPLLRRDR